MSSVPGTSVSRGIGDKHSLSMHRTGRRVRWLAGLKRKAGAEAPAFAGQAEACPYVPSLMLYFASVALSAGSFARRAFASAIAGGVIALASAYAVVVASVGTMPPMSPVLACPIRVSTFGLGAP